MTKMVLARKAVNKEKRAMSKQGTQYRRDTAVYVSRLMNDLLSSGLSKPPSRANLVRMIKLKYKVDDERAQDVAKSVKVNFSRVQDRERLADLYEQARKRLDNKSRVSRVKRKEVLK